MTSTPAGPQPTPDPSPADPADQVDPPEPKPTAPSDESPDRDTPAWEGPGAGPAVGLVDPRHEIPTPPGL